MLAATKVKMSGSEKKRNRNTYNISPIKLVTGKFLAEFNVVVVQNNGKKCMKKRAARAKLFLFC